MKRMLARCLAVMILSTLCAYSSTRTATLTVVVEGFRNDNGNAVCHLFNSKDGYPVKSKKAMMLRNSKITNGRATFVFENIPYGDYAFTSHHDENANKKMDLKWIGIPAEGWACSNNAKGSLIKGLPKWEEARFTVSKPTVTKTIKMNY